jgi:hypothetical protein
MKLKLKDEYIDMAISHPMTGKIVALRFLDKEEYIILYNKGLEILFEKEILEEKIKKTEDKKTEI